MKTQLLASMIALLTFVACGPIPQESKLETNVTSVPYYRFWQGWKRKDISQSEFLGKLKSFMPLTPKTHARNGLLAYTVAIPPKNNAAWIADEFALVTYKSKAIYERAKKTPEGQKYANAHWDLFEKGPSKSAVPMRVDPRKTIQVKIGNSYDVLSRPVDWQKGFTTFYFGVRKKGLSNEAYEKGMSRHVELVKRGFYRQGMQGYLILVTDRYEIAYQNWKSEAHFKRAMQSKAGRMVQSDAARLLKTFMFQPAKTFNGSARPNQAINFRFRHL